MAARKPFQLAVGNSTSFLESMRPFYAGAGIAVVVSSIASYSYLPRTQVPAYQLLSVTLVIGYLALFRHGGQPAWRLQLVNYLLQLGWLGLTAIASVALQPEDTNRSMLLVMMCSGMFFYSLGWCLLAQITILSVWWRLTGGHPWTPHAIAVHAIVAPTIGLLIFWARRASHTRMLYIHGMEADLAQKAAILSHSSRLSMMGQCMTTLTHEVKQPLAAITHLSELLAHHLAKTPPEFSASLTRHVGEIQRQCNVAADIVRRLRVFTKPDDARRSPEDINSIVDDSLALMAYSAHQHTAIITKTLANPPVTVPVDRVQIQQVLMNLVVNALESLADSSVRDPAICVAVHPLPDALEVSVSDNGPGVRDQIGDVFSPFVTSKADGLGLGLAISRSIVESHGGQLDLRRTPDGQTCFYFRIPYQVSPPVGQLRGGEAGVTRHQRGTQRVSTGN